jgi:nucleoside-diphosphate-sugar epimerase
MKVFVIGGTGLVGSYLLPRLVDNSHEVVALTRSKDKIEKINKLGAVGLLGDIRNPQSFTSNLPGQPDMIVLLAMPAVKPGERMTKKRKEELRRETNDFFRNSMDLAIHFNIPIILPSGTSFKTQNDKIADETWPILRVGLTEIGKDTDEMVNQAIKTQNPKVIQLIYEKFMAMAGCFVLCTI